MPPFIPLSGDKRLHPVLAHVSASYPSLTGRLPTCYSPIRRSFHRRPSEDFCLLPARDLHVLGTPPAFVLSQDQTLHKVYRSRSEEHTSELQSRFDLVCRLLLEKKKQT